MKYNVDQFIKDRLYYKNGLKTILDDFNEFCEPILIDIFETVIKYREISCLYSSKYPLFEDFFEYDDVEDNDELKYFSIDYISSGHVSFSVETKYKKEVYIDVDLEFLRDDKNYYEYKNKFIKKYEPILKEKSKSYEDENKNRVEKQLELAKKEVEKLEKELEILNDKQGE